MRPLKSSFSATPLDGVDGVLGVVGPVGVVGSDGESFAPPHAAMVMPHNASAAVSSLTWSDIGGGDPCFGVSDANQPKNSTSTRLATQNRDDVFTCSVAGPAVPATASLAERLAAYSVLAPAPC